MLTITDHTPPPLKFSGLVLISVQISVSLSFQVDSAEFRLSMIQFPLPIFDHLDFRKVPQRWSLFHLWGVVFTAQAE